MTPEPELVPILAELLSERDVMSDEDRARVIGSVGRWRRVQRLPTAGGTTRGAFLPGARTEEEVPEEGDVAMADQAGAPMDWHDQALLDEIITQCQFAIKAKADMDREQVELVALLESPPEIHAMMTRMSQLRLRLKYHEQSCLVALALVSRFLGFHKAVKDKPRREALRARLRTDETSALYARDVRDCFEHFDERIDAHFKDGPRGWIDSNLSMGNALGGLGPGVEAIRHTDLDEGIVQGRKQDGSAVQFSLNNAVEEARRIKSEAVKVRSESRRSAWLPDGAPDFPMAMIDPDAEDLQ